MTAQEFEHIYSSIWSKLTGLARQFGRATGICLDEEDVAQEALIALWELSEQGYPIRNPEALLVRITKVNCVARLRKHKMDTVPIEGDKYNGGDSATKTVDIMDEAEIKRRLYECLTKAEREYMTLKAENDMTLDEISAITGVRKPGISTALSKAKKKLKEQIKKLEYGGQ